MHGGKRLMRRFLGALAVVCALATAGFAAPAEGQSHTVKISGMTFQPASLEVQVGDDITWVNEDIVPHTVNGPGFASGNLSSGTSWKFTATKKGDISYACAFHPTMRGHLLVADKKK